MNITRTKRYLSFFATIALSMLVGFIIANLYHQRSKLAIFSLENDRIQVTPTITQSPPDPEELVRDKQIEYFVNDVLSASPASELANKTIIKADPVTTTTGTDWIVEAFNPEWDDCPSKDYCNHKSYYYSEGKAVDISVLGNSVEGAPTCHVDAVDDITSWRAPWTATPSTQTPILFIQQTCNSNYPFYNVYQLIDFQKGKLIPFRDTTGAIPKNMIDSYGQVWGNTFVDQHIYGSGPFLLISDQKVQSEKSEKGNSYLIFRLNLGKHTVDKHSVL